MNCVASGTAPLKDAPEKSNEQNPVWRHECSPVTVDISNPGLTFEVSETGAATAQTPSNASGCLFNVAVHQRWPVHVGGI